MRKELILGLLGITLFFMVMTVLYGILSYTQGREDVFVPVFPFIVLSGFFIFLVGAMLVALSLSRIISQKYSF